MRLFTCAGLVCAFALGVACSKNSSDERTGISSAALVTAPGQPGNLGMPHIDPSAVFSRRTGAEDTFATSYSDYGSWNGELAQTAWAFSTDAQSWTLCKGVSPGPGCGAPLRKLSNHRNWLGKSSLAENGAGDVVMFTLVDTDGQGNTAERLVALISNDGGRTFGDHDAIEVNGDNCNDGWEDLPHATFDKTTDPPTVWVAWRHNGKGPVGGCVRRGHLVGNPANGIQWDLGSTPVPHWFNDPLWGVGGIMIQAGRGSATVVYSTSGHLFACPEAGTVSMGWASATSFDGGQTWDPNLSPSDVALTGIDIAPGFRWCGVRRSQVPVQMSFREFGYVRTPSGDDWVAVPDMAARGVRIFQSASQGHAWRERCADRWISPIWGQERPLCPTPALPADGPTVFRPTIASDANGRLMVMFYTSDAADANVAVKLFGHVNPRTSPALPTGGWQELAGFLQQPFQVRGQSLALGETMSFAVRPGPGCGGPPGQGDPNDGEFFPFWVFMDGPQPIIKDRRIVLMP